MKGLKIENWKDWEDLCCFFMEDMAKQNGYSVKYQSYGSQGQSQHGVDLVPVKSNLPLVGQCKLRETQFKWQDVLNEVAKTDSYPGEIRCYVLFTTANKHTTIIDVQNKGGVYYHTRRDDSKFSVHVRNWADYDLLKLKCVPQDVLRRIFPHAFSLAEAAQSLSADEYISSLKALQSYVPTRINKSDLAWLENFDFTQGWVSERAYDQFRNLHWDVLEVESALENGNAHVLARSGYPEIKASLLAGKEFYSALKEFTVSIREVTAGSGPIGTPHSVLTIRDLLGWESKAHEFHRNARYLAQVYRKFVLGEPEQ